MASFLSEKSKIYFTKIFDLAVEYKKEDIEAYFNSDLQTKLMDNILFIYAMKIPKYESSNMDGTAFINYLFANQAITSIDSSFLRTLQTEIQSEDQIRCQFKDPFNNILVLHMIRENSEWRIDMMPNLIYSDQKFLQFIENSGTTRTQFLDNLINTGTYLNNLISFAIPR